MIDILLATYNSSKYLAEAINSILAQNYSEWRLLVRDGGSQDNTLEIISEYIQQYPDKIILLPCEGKFSACENFFELLMKSSADYVMFCDHDDIWLPDKISKSLVRMKQAECEHGTNSPLLIFTDKRVVDQKLTIISDSYLKYQNLNPENITLNRLLVQNVPSGCTMLLNRALVDVCATIPLKAFMHDHWISLAAAAFGQIFYLPEPTILYRQHNQNVLGSSKYGWGYFFQSYEKGLGATKQRFYQNVTQASAFYEWYKKDLTSKQSKLLKEFSNLENMSWLNRRKVLLRNKILKTGLRRNLGMMLII